MLSTQERSEITILRRRILVVYPYVPYPLDRGTYQRTYHLLKQMASKHTVDFFALCDEPVRMRELARFQAFCRRAAFFPFTFEPWPKLLSRLSTLKPASVARWYSAAAEQALQKFMEGQDYDMVYACDLAMAQYFLDGRVPLVVDRSRVDLEFQLASQRHLQQSWRQHIADAENIIKMRAFERKLARTAALEIVCGEDDVRFLREHVDADMPVLALPNGVDEDHFNPSLVLEKPATDPTLIFCGAMDYTPNVDALRWFFSDIHPRLLELVPSLRCLVVGRSPTAEIEAFSSKKGVVVTGGVPDVRPYYRRAWLQVVPLRIGGGSRLKIPESLAMGTPVVSTTIGAQGLGLIGGKHLLIADDPGRFAQETARLLNDADLRARLAKQGAEEVKKRLTWKAHGLTLSCCLAGFEPQAAETEEQPAQSGPVLDSRPTVPLIGIPFDNVTVEKATNRIVAMVKSRCPHQVATANVDFTAKASSDRELKEALLRSHLVVCDGMPLIWLSRLLRMPLPERVAGASMVPILLRKAEELKWKVFFLGGTPENLEKAAAAARIQHPKLRLVGTYSPPFAPLGQMNNDEIMGRVHAASPDILFVAFGCPKQEKWIARHLHQLNVPVCMGVGASLDFIAGFKARAPHWAQKSGLEWLFRLAQEPRRLLGRYSLDLLVLLWGTIKQARYFVRNGDQPKELSAEDAHSDVTLDCSCIQKATVGDVGTIARLERNLHACGCSLTLKNVSPRLASAIKACGFEGIWESEAQYSCKLEKKIA
jgi:exopolysaccharide biosynthesis WecB/TagA/CpsF family protein